MTWNSSFLFFPFLKMCENLACFQAVGDLFQSLHSSPTDDSCIAIMTTLKAPSTDSFCPYGSD